MAWVVRAGAAGVKSLIEGYNRHLGVPGLFGFSVQYAPGKTVEELAQVARFPHGQISYADDAILAAAVAPLGYSVQLIKCPGGVHHHTFIVLYDASGVALHVLPRDAAVIISRTFQRRPNPYLHAW